MPELPEVETIVRTLRPHVEGLYLVKALEVKRPCVLPEGLPLSEAEGLRLDGVSRRGKLILMNLDTGEEGRIMHVVLHLRMTGSLLAQDREAPFDADAMPGMAGDEATVQALGLQPDLKIITLSMYGEEVYYTRMMTAGAKGFLLKDSDFSEVIEAIDTVSAGGSYICHELLVQLTGRLHTPQRAQSLLDGGEELSSREQEILVMVCRGLSNQEIADELFISKRTVDKHRANILEKTGCKNTANLVVYAIKRGLVEI